MVSSVHAPHVTKAAESRILAYIASNKIICTPHGKRRQTTGCSDNFLTHALLFGDLVEGTILDSLISHKVNWSTLGEIEFCKEKYILKVYILFFW